MAVDRTTDRGPLNLTEFAHRMLVVVVIVGITLLVWRIVDALLLAFIGVLFAILLRGLATTIHRYTRIPVLGALLLVLTLLVLSVGVFTWFVGPLINTQLAQFMKQVPGALGQIQEFLKQYTLGQFVLDYMERSRLPEDGGAQLFTHATGIVSAIATVATHIVLVIVAGIYFAVDPQTYQRGLLLLVPKSQFLLVADTLDKTAQTLHNWLLGQLIAMASVGVMVWLGLWLVGVPLALLLGFISGLLEFIPIIGPVAGAVPGVLIAISGGWTKAIYAVLVYIVVQQIENHVLIPLIQKRAVSLPPALVVLAVVALGLLFGILGVLVATPLAAVIMVWVKTLYVQDVLGKPLDPKGSPLS